MSILCITETSEPKLPVGTMKRELQEAEVLQAVVEISPSALALCPAQRPCCRGVGQEELTGMDEGDGLTARHLQGSISYERMRVQGAQASMQEFTAHFKVRL